MNRSLIILTMGIAGAGVGIFGLVRYINHMPSYTEMVLSSDEAKRDFLSECGCTLKEEPPSKQEIILPKDGDSWIFGDYCTLQKEQMLPLTEHLGEEAVIWTYSVENSPSACAELICTQDGLLLGAMGYDRRSFDRMYPLIT